MFRFKLSDYKIANLLVMFQQTAAGTLSARTVSARKVLSPAYDEAVVCKIEWNN